MSVTDVDVVIIGAGISGIGAAYRITERNPGTSYVILLRRFILVVSCVVLVFSCVC